MGGLSKLFGIDAMAESLTGTGDIGLLKRTEQIYCVAVGTMLGAGRIPSNAELRSIVANAYVAAQKYEGEG